MLARRDSRRSRYGSAALGAARLAGSAWRAGVVPRVNLRNLINRGKQYFRNTRSFQSQSTASQQSMDSPGSFAPLRVDNPGTGGQLTSFSRQNKLYIDRSVIKTLPPTDIKFNWSQHVESTIGTQQAGSWTIGNQSDLATIWTDMSGSTNQRIFIESIIGSVLFQNVRLGNCTFTIYDCIAKRDLSHVNTATALAAWSKGITNQGGASEFDYGVYGARPNETELFNTYWKVANRTQIVLGGGMCHKHNFSLGLNRVIPYELMNKCGYGIEDFTYCVLYVVSGPAANSDTTHTEVSLGSASMTTICSTVYRCKMLNKNSANIYKHVNLATTLTGGEAVVNVGGSTLTINNEA